MSVPVFFGTPCRTDPEDTSLEQVRVNSKEREVEFTYRIENALDLKFVAVAMLVTIVVCIMLIVTMANLIAMRNLRNHGRTNETGHSERFRRTLTEIEF